MPPASAARKQRHYSPSFDFVSKGRDMDAQLLTVLRGTFNAAERAQSEALLEQVRLLHPRVMLAAKLQQMYLSCLHVRVDCATPRRLQLAQAHMRVCAKVISVSNRSL